MANNKLTDKRLDQIYAECEDHDPAIVEIRELVAELQERRKADTEPVAWTDEQELRELRECGFAYLYTVNPITPHADPRRVIKLYAASPAPVIPDEIEPDSNNTYDYVDGWNACRAAMLSFREK